MQAQIDINQFVHEMDILGFKQINNAYWIVAKNNITAAFWGNYDEPDLGDLTIKRWDKNIEDKPNGKICLETVVYENKKCADLGKALNLIKGLLCKQN
jgi:hypothetical protein